MAKYVKLDELKAQCNVEHNEDDLLMQKQLDAAEAWVEKTLQCPLSDYEYTPDGSKKATIPESIQQAVLIFAAGLYSNREANSFGAAPTPIMFNLMSLLTPYIKFT